MLYYARPTKPKSAFVHIFHSELCVLVDFVYFFGIPNPFIAIELEGFAEWVQLLFFFFSFSGPRAVFGIPMKSFSALEPKSRTRERRENSHFKVVYAKRVRFHIKIIVVVANESANLRESERVVGGGGWRREWSTVQYIKQNSQKLNTQQKNSIAPATPREWVKLHGKTFAH